MTNYSRKPAQDGKSAHTSRKDIRAHYKNTYETARAIQGLSLKKAQTYLASVLEHKQCIPVRRYNSHVARTGQATQFGVTQGRWFDKSVKIIQELLTNLESNAKAKQLDVSKLIIRHVQVNRAPKTNRRTYRAHGRVTPYRSSPCHVEIFAEEPFENVPKPEKKTVGRITARKEARSKIRRFLAVGGDKKN